MSEKSIENEIKFFVKSERGWVTKIHADGVQGKDTVDLIGGLYGKPFYVEVKKDEHEEPSKIQEYLLDRAAQSGYVAGCIGSLEAFKDLFVQSLHDQPMFSQTLHSVLTIRDLGWTTEEAAAVRGSYGVLVDDWDDPDVDVYDLEDTALKTHREHMRKRVIPSGVQL